MKSPDQLKATRQDLTPRQQGIYFLFDGEELVYVGISTDIATRVITHRNNPNKVFDSFSWYPVEDPEEMARLEADYIFRDTPKYNMTMLPKSNICVAQKNGRGRPAKRGRVHFVNIRLREGEHDLIIARLEALPLGKRSDYVRRVLEGAPVEVHEHAESAALTADLDSMFSDDDW